MIASGGYPPSLVTATRDYLTRLLARLDDPDLDKESLESFIAPELAAGTLTYFAPYEAVHSQNIAALRGAKTRRIRGHPPGIARNRLLSKSFILTRKARRETKVDPLVSMTEPK
ncbi:MAG: hypothetical protein U5N27_18950 [Rhizobium sp.]|nr:hypothetical protein [Rhizobium sp.]